MNVPSIGSLRAAAQLHEGNVAIRQKEADNAAALLRMAVEGRDATYAELLKRNLENELSDIKHVFRGIGMSVKFNHDRTKIKCYTGDKDFSTMHSDQIKTSLSWKSCSGELVRRLTARIIQLEGS